MIPQAGQIWKLNDCFPNGADAYFMIIRYTQTTEKHGECWDAQLLGCKSYREMEIGFGGVLKDKWELVSG